MVLWGLILLFFITVENGQCKPKKEEEGPTLKPSSPRLGTCEGQIWIYPCPPIIISKHAFSNVCGLPLRPPWLLPIFIHKTYFHLPRFIWKSAWVPNGIILRLFGLPKNCAMYIGTYIGYLKMFCEIFLDNKRRLNGNNCIQILAWVEWCSMPLAVVVKFIPVPDAPFISYLTPWRQAGPQIVIREGG